jgi:hypothetical protein
MSLPQNRCTLLRDMLYVFTGLKQQLFSAFFPLPC